METPISIIEKWWRGLGCWDREQVTGIRYKYTTAQKYLCLTDDWWDNLNEEQKRDTHNEFFCEY